MKCFSDTATLLIRQRQRMGQALIRDLQFQTASDGVALYSSPHSGGEFVLLDQRGVWDYPQTLSVDSASLSFVLESGEILPVHSREDGYYADILHTSPFNSGLLMPLKIDDHIPFVVLLNSHEARQYKGEVFKFCGCLQNFVQTLLLCEEVNM